MKFFELCIEEGHQRAWRLLLYSPKRGKNLHKLKLDKSKHKGLFVSLDLALVGAWEEPSATTNQPAVAARALNNCRSNQRFVNWHGSSMLDASWHRKIYYHCTSNCFTDYSSRELFLLQINLWQAWHKLGTLWFYHCFKLRYFCHIILITGH